MGKWTGSVWLGIGQSTFGYNKMRKISYPAEDMLVSQERLRSMELVSQLVQVSLFKCNSYFKYTIELTKRNTKALLLKLYTSLK